MSRELTDAEIDLFLNELTLLSQKHDIVIHGCGCCGSPSVWPIEDMDGSHYKYEPSHIGPEVDWVE